MLEIIVTVFVTIIATKVFKPCVVWLHNYYKTKIYYPHYHKFSPQYRILRKIETDIFMPQFEAFNQNNLNEDDLPVISDVLALFDENEHEMLRKVMADMAIYDRNRNPNNKRHLTKWLIPRTTGLKELQFPSGRMVYVSWGLTSHFINNYGAKDITGYRTPIHTRLGADQYWGQERTIVKILEIILNFLKIPRI